MKIGICSDLHLEFGEKDFPLPDADVLILAGDIFIIDDLRASFKDTKNGLAIRNFLSDVSAKYNHVIFIPGNHEYYGGNIDTSEQKVNGFLRSEGLANITFSAKGSIKIDTVKFIFATLWTDINNANPVSVCANVMNDYKNISCLDHNLPSGDRLITPYDTISIHVDHKQFISNELKNSDSDVIVISHHAPNILSTKNRNLSSVDFFYCCTDMDDIILDNPQIKYWIHGHLHTRKEYEIGTTKVMSNCRGYCGFESSVKTFDVKVIEI